MTPELARALHAFQKDAPPIHLDATNPQRVSRLDSQGRPRDKHDNLLDECPDCGSLKLGRVPRCRPCSGIARRGEHRTDNPSNSTGWSRARAARPLQTCEYPDCESFGMDRHHIDGNPLNNDLSNISVYCRRHHMTVDGRLESLAERGPRVGRLFGGRRKKEAA